ncbi:PLD nuclease N-terminal domain-containing protein [Corynebacterium oculi]|uniref:Cardiolipin synthase N-terminal domain-containing protein n=1 Tax=Corynebacterium oculi TaxID=1544416 RepID=A0A0Q1DXF9_9CORY|nr:PLD nuclease N-terminal domain-containing protein [Corynebacterium oculi]KQB84916.1 hypothetical protein Cocul_00046 [Corynebacterium oculi]
MPNIGTTELLIFAPFAMAMFVLPIVALIFLFRDRRPGVETAVWCLVIVIATFLGPIAYLVWRKVEQKDSPAKPPLP